MVSSRGRCMKDERELPILVGLYSRLTSWPFLWLNLLVSWTGFSGGSAGKESSCNVGDLGSVPGLGKSPGEGKGYPLRYSGLKNSVDCIIHGVAKSFCAKSQKVFGHMLQSRWTRLMVSWKAISYTWTSSLPPSWQRDKMLVQPTVTPFAGFASILIQKGGCAHRRFMQTLSLFQAQSPVIECFLFQSWKLHFRIDDDFSCCFSISFLSFSFFCFTFLH